MPKKRLKSTNHGFVDKKGPKHTKKKLAVSQKAKKESIKSHLIQSRKAKQTKINKANSKKPVKPLTKAQQLKLLQKCVDRTIFQHFKSCPCKKLFIPKPKRFSWCLSAQRDATAQQKYVKASYARAAFHRKQYSQCHKAEQKAAKKAKALSKKQNEAKMRALKAKRWLQKSVIDCKQALKLVKKS